MADQNPQHHRLPRSSHQYHQVQVSNGARAQLGDTYHINRENLLSLLPIATNAPFNSYDRQHEPTCLPNTRVDVLQKISRWTHSEDQKGLFWLSGMAGTGKSTISRTIAQMLHEEGRLGASFFFTKGGGDVSHAGKFVTSIAVQLAGSVAALRPFICNVVEEQNDIASKSLREQWQQLVLGPLLKLDSNSSISSYIIVVDALDECHDDKNMQIILQLFSEARSLQSIGLRIFLTSRPEIPIRYGFNHISKTEYDNFVLHNISQSIVDHDISTFLKHGLRVIGQERNLGAGWPSEDNIKILVRTASGLFIWAATAYRFIWEGKQFAAKRLAIILENDNNATTTSVKYLNGLYITTLKHSTSSDYTDKERKELYGMLRHVLGSVVILLSPLSIESLSMLLCISASEIHQTLEDLHAIVDISNYQSRPLRLHHPSFRDFLLDKDRCSDSNFWVDEKQAHKILANGCVGLMSAVLKEDICRFNNTGTTISEVDRSHVEQCLPPAVQYACLYWVQHLQRSDFQLPDYDEIYFFLREHLLHWLEALSWMQNISEGILALVSLESIIAIENFHPLYHLVRDFKRFAFYFRSAVEAAPLQLYCIAVFAPETSAVRLQHGSMPRWVKKSPLVPKNWSRSISTLEGHTNCVNAVTLSPDGKQLASASDDGTVRTWDTATGAALFILVGHSTDVVAVAFLPDGKQLISVSSNRTIILWDAATGAVISQFKGNLNLTGPVVFSPHRELMASVSTLDDDTVRLWDVGNGKELQILKGHSDRVRAVAFSPDGKLLTSASSDATVLLWDAALGMRLQQLEGHLKFVAAVVFSPSGKLLASASADTTVRLWGTATGKELQRLKGHSRMVTLVAFSPDSNLLASGSWDQTISLWDVTTGLRLLTIEVAFSIPKIFEFLTFSPDGKELASAATDEGTVCLWDSTTGEALSILKDHSSVVVAVAFSLNGKSLVSASWDNTLRLWDLATAEAFSAHDRYSYSASDFVFSPNRQHIASKWKDYTIRLWDAATGAALSVLRGHRDWIRAVVFSPDGKLLAAASSDSRVRLWDVFTGEALMTFRGHSDVVWDVKFSPDGKHLASASGDKTVRLWDTTTGAAVKKLEGHISSVLVVVFSPDGKTLASADLRSFILWSATTRLATHKVDDNSPWHNSLTFSTDGKQLASISENWNVKLWDTTTGTVLQIFGGHSSDVNAVAFSPDGKQLASSSRDKTVKLWDASTGYVLYSILVDASVESISFSSDGLALETERGS